MTHPWKAGELAQGNFSSSHDSRGEMLRGAQTKATARMAAGRTTQLASFAVSIAGGIAGVVGSVIAEKIAVAQFYASGGWVIHDPHFAQSPLQWAVFDSSMAVLGGGLLAGILAGQWIKREAAKKDPLAPAVDALEAGATPQEAIDATLGEELAAKLAGWRTAAPEPCTAPKPR